MRELTGWLKGLTSIRFNKILRRLSFVLQPHAGSVIKNQLLSKILNGSQNKIVQLEVIVFKISRILL